MPDKKPVRSVRRLYEIAPGKEQKVELDGQARIVLDSLKREQPASMFEIAKAAARKLDTKQEPIRVVNHYLGKFRAARIVRVAKLKRAA